MPLGDNRLADSDLQTRFTGGLLATNLIQYWECVGGGIAPGRLGLVAFGRLSMEGK